MCYKSVRSFTKSRYISKDSASKFLVEFPCGYCSDCIRKKRSEWSLRAYYEAKSCFDKNGFVLFDTLTSEDSQLQYFHDIYPPAINNAWDFPAFSRLQINHFLHRLRKLLLRGCSFDAPYLVHGKPSGRTYKVVIPSYPDSKGNLRYFLTSEYGTDDKGTHRPHYHVLFFVTFDIEPYILSQAIYHAWQHGSTDGFPFHNRNYVYSKRLITSSRSDNLKLIRYVSKYIGKDMYLFGRLYKRVYMSYTLQNPNWFDYYDKRLEFQRFKNSVLPFHLQSKGFGLSALDYEDFDYLISYNAVRMPISSAGVIASIPLSTYYRRKLFYDVRKIDGRLMWFPNKLYYQQFKSRYQNSVVNLRNKLFMFDNSIGLENATKVAHYALLWRGRLLSHDQLSFTNDQLLDFICKPPTPLSLSVVNDRVWYNYNTPKDRYGRGCRISNIMFHHDKSLRLVSWSHHEFLVHPPDGYVVVSSLSVPEFAYYDDFLDRYWQANYNDGLLKDFEQRSKDRQLDRYKMLGFLNS